MKQFLVGFLATVTAVIAVLAVWLAVTGLLAMRSVSQLQAEVRMAVAEGSDGNFPDAAARIPDIAEQAHRLDGTFNGFPWTWAADFPIVGESVSALASISQATSRTLESFSASEVNLDDSDQGLDVGVLEDSAANLNAMSQVANDEVEQVQAIDTSQILSPLQPQIDRARGQFLDLERGLDAAAGAANALPTVLGYHGQRTWLVILQNTSEARGTGGLVGAYSIMKVKNGKFDPIVTDSNNSLTSSKISTKGIPADTRFLWGDNLAHTWGLNLDRHYPFAARLMPRTLPAGSPEIDDVITLDPAAVAALIEMSGSVTAGGVELTGGNAEDYLTREVYVQFPDPVEKDKVVVELLESALGQLSGAPIDLPGVWAAMAPLIGEQRLLVASRQPKLQAQLERLPTAGLVPEAPGPWTTVGVNNWAGSKTDAFVKLKVRYESASLCPTDTGTSRILVTAETNAPIHEKAYGRERQDKGGGPPGSTKLLLAISAPVGSQFRGAKLDGEEDRAEVRFGQSRNHPVWKQMIEVEQGEPKSLEVTFDEPYWPNVTPLLQPQPMVRDMEVTVERPSDC